MNATAECCFCGVDNLLARTDLDSHLWNIVKVYSMGKSLEYEMVFDAKKKPHRGKEQLNKCSPALRPVANNYYSIY